MKNYFLIAAFALLCSASIAQPSENRIVVQNHLKQNIFLVEGEDAANYVPAKGFKGLEPVLSRYPESAALYRKAKNQYNCSQIFGFVGGFMIGYPIGSSLGGREFNVPMAATGAAIIVIAFPVAKSANQNLMRAIDVYNNGGVAPTSQ